MERKRFLVCLHCFADRGHFSSSTAPQAFPRPDRRMPMPARAGRVKAGRLLAATVRLGLDTAEHDGTLVWLGASRFFTSFELGWRRKVVSALAMEGSNRSRGARLRTRSYHRVATLYSVDPFGPNHDAVIRIDGEAPRRRIQSRSRHESHRHERNPATSDRYRQSVNYRDSSAETHCNPNGAVIAGDLRPLAARHRRASRRLSPNATGQ